MASIRLQQDLVEPDPESAYEDTLVRARIAILNKQAREAIELLKPFADKADAAALKLFAQLRGQTRSPKHVLQAAYHYLGDKKIDKEFKVNLWAVISEAAQQMGRRGTRASALEHILADRKNLTLDESIFKVDSDTLWNAYIDYAVQISNKEQLLIGQDKEWLDVSRRIKTEKPVGARAMSVFVMLRSHSDEYKEQAAEMFTQMLKKRKSASTLLTELFLNSKHYPASKDIPVSVRHVLVDIALNNSDIDRASELMATIKEPPEGSDKFMWWLRRARILVLGNQTEVGAQALHDLLDKNKELEQEQIDKFLQVVFDLQTAGKQELAYGLFERILSYSKDQQVQREIYYWMADARKSQKHYIEAAQLYLKSAMHPDPENMDPWAQTAHYQAAVALARAGLYDDATTLFKHLLRVTEDPTRRATLQRELQRLWAMQ
jgi:tetratricopeptide (TPR) repeat protein